MEITTAFIESIAPNAAAASNGKSLARNSFISLKKNAEGNLLFGECAGSGKKPYVCSVDFINPQNPIARCSCPSRQIPCKHALGLLYAYAMGKSFETGDTPDDVLSKRDKIEKKVEKASEKTAAAKEKAPTPPSKAKINSAIKKIEAQLEGIALAEKLLSNIVQSGLASLDSKQAATYNQQVKQLGNFYITGIQTVFSELFLVLEPGGDATYAPAIQQVLYIQALLKKSRDYLEAKKANPAEALKLDVTSAIEEQIGRAWKLDELLENNSYVQNAVLVQLAFYAYDDEARKEYVEEGYFICLNDGRIYIAKNYRPYKAVKFIKEEDSQFRVLQTETLYVYPGDMNPRVRYNGFELRALQNEDIAKVLNFAKENFTEVVKSVKNQIKSPLANKNPLALLKVDKARLLENEEGREFIEITDKTGARQLLCNTGFVDVDTLTPLKGIEPALLRNQGILVMYENDVTTGFLYAKPLAVVTSDGIVRLAY